MDKPAPLLKLEEGWNHAGDARVKRKPVFICAGMMASRTQFLQFCHNWGDISHFPYK